MKLSEIQVGYKQTKSYIVGTLQNRYKEGSLKV